MGEPRHLGRRGEGLRRDRAGARSVDLRSDDPTLRQEHVRPRLRLLGHPRLREELQDAAAAAARHRQAASRPYQRRDRGPRPNIEVQKDWRAPQFLQESINRVRAFLEKNTPMIRRNSRSCSRPCSRRRRPHQAQEVWGAVATDNERLFGVSAGMATREAAETSALAECGPLACRIRMPRRSAASPTPIATTGRPRATAPPRPGRPPNSPPGTSATRGCPATPAPSAARLLQVDFRRSAAPEFASSHLRASWIERNTWTGRSSEVSDMNSRPKSPRLPSATMAQRPARPQHRHRAQPLGDALEFILADRRGGRGDVDDLAVRQRAAVDQFLHEHHAGRPARSRRVRPPRPSGPAKRCRS